ncbi:MAG: RNA pseudouridine synthase [Spirochaetaceae bacterium]|jgi:23S rRNA pseudouridine1911/1915/1917 synthase|nr:RNA pseudouridine synthase [Spirochaetaceae bacterium]
MFEPKIVVLKPGYFVAYKPPRMHSVFLKKQKSMEGREETLLDWCSRRYPEVLEVVGRNPWEGGILHRLDYETEGLVLFARTQEAMDSFLAQQRDGKFSKTYGALSAGMKGQLPGYPPKPVMVASASADAIIIESGFRPYGPGRETVRPVVRANIPREKIYRTGILAAENIKGFTVFTVRIQRGFRHQIRCHLAWIGFPLVNDPLYGGETWRAYTPLDMREGEEGDSLHQVQPFLALRAQGISFDDLDSGERREYSLPPIVPPLL